MKVVQHIWAKPFLILLLLAAPEGSAGEVGGSSPAGGLALGAHLARRGAAGGAGDVGSSPAETRNPFCARGEMPSAGGELQGGIWGWQREDVPEVRKSPGCTLGGHRGTQHPPGSDFGFVLPTLRGCHRIQERFYCCDRGGKSSLSVEHSFVCFALQGNKKVPTLQGPLRSFRNGHKMPNPIWDQTSSG